MSKKMSKNITVASLREILRQKILNKDKLLVVSVILELIKAKYGRIRDFKFRIRIGEKTRIHPDPKHGFFLPLAVR